MVLLTGWMLWKDRNACTFEGARACVAEFHSQTREEASLWDHAAVLGLRAWLPAAWGVH